MRIQTVQCETSPAFAPQTAGLRNSIGLIAASKERAVDLLLGSEDGLVLFEITARCRSRLKEIVHAQRFCSDHRLLLLVAAAGSASAQSSIDPGMTKDQVIAKLGKPASEHSSGTSTYLYYANGEEKKVGMSDMVALEDGKVVDAVFRSPNRKYSGKSSSPAPVPTDVAIAKGNGGTMPEKHSAPMKMPETAHKAPETKKPAPPAAKAPEAKRAAPTTAKAPETKKAAPPAAKTPEPKTKVDTKKIAAPPAKPDSSNKKSAPAPTKKP